MLRILLAAGADTSVVAYRGFNIFSELSVQRRVLAAEWLLRRDDSDIDVHHLNGGKTAIMELIYGSAGVECESLLELILSKGVDINAQTFNTVLLTEGFTAIHFAVIELRYESASRVAYLNILLKHGANPHAVDSYGLTPTARAMKTSQSFFRWRKSLEEYGQLSEEFAIEDVSRSSYLRSAGWDGHSLFKLFTCKFRVINGPWIQIDCEDYYGKGEGLCWEPWWYDLLRYIRLKRVPIPPLPRGWQEFTSKAGHTSYFNQELGIHTWRRPGGKFFSDLCNRKARKAYAEGKVEIETRLPRPQINRRSHMKRRRYLTFLKELYAYIDRGNDPESYQDLYPLDDSGNSEVDSSDEGEQSNSEEDSESECVSEEDAIGGDDQGNKDESLSDEDNGLGDEGYLSYDEDEQTDQWDDESDIALEWSDEEDDLASRQGDDSASGEQANTIDEEEEELYEDAVEALQEVHINP